MCTRTKQEKNVMMYQNWDLQFWWSKFTCKFTCKWSVHAIDLSPKLYPNFCSLLNCTNIGLLAHKLWYIFTTFIMINKAAQIGSWWKFHLYSATTLEKVEWHFYRYRQFIELSLIFKCFILVTQQHKIILIDLFGEKIFIFNVRSQKFIHAIAIITIPCNLQHRSS